MCAYQAHNRLVDWQGVLVLGLGEQRFDLVTQISIARTSLLHEGRAFVWTPLRRELEEFHHPVPAFVHRCRAACPCLSLLLAEMGSSNRTFRRAILRHDKIGVTMPPSAPEITALLQAWRSGDELALERLTPLVYDHLRVLGRQYARRELQG
jgi:hypothetical protein